MNVSDIRMMQQDDQPDDSEVRGWIGENAHKYWKQISRWIEKNYPGVFTPEWIYGGRKHGWSLRYKKNKSFCTLIPEKDRFSLLIVFGKEERTKVESIRAGLSENTGIKYDEATTYHDGKWLLLTIDSEEIIQDAIKLLSVKRKAKLI